jgi:hypothetical protein
MPQVIGTWKPPTRKRRYTVEWKNALGTWARESGPGYRLYLSARFNVSLWNSIDTEARIIDNWKEEDR